MSILRRLFHKCENHLVPTGYRFPLKGTTGRGKVWKNYQCSVCGKYYTTAGRKIYRVLTPDACPMYFIK